MIRLADTKLKPVGRARSGCRQFRSAWSASRGEPL